MFFDGTDESRESPRITESTLLDFLEDLGEIGIKVVRAVGVCVAEIFNVLGQIAKEEDIVLANFSGDFNLLKLETHKRQEE